MQVIIEQISTKFKRYYPNIDVISDKKQYITLDLDLSDFADGEYVITVYTDNNEKIGEDIIRIGDYKTTKTEYKIEKKFTQYVRK